jgi:hypothetical protein
MTRVFTIVFQVLGLVVQLGSALTNIVPDKYKLLFGTVIGAIQAIQAAVAHNYNPDGTPATVAYVPPTK